MVIVEALDFGGDGKVARKMQDKLKTILPEASLFLASLDDDLTKYAPVSPPPLCDLTPPSSLPLCCQGDNVRHLLRVPCRSWPRLQGVVRCLCGRCGCGQGRREECASHCLHPSRGRRRKLP
jgi:hypothetical protein